MAASDVEVIRDLARRYAELCAEPEQERRRELWRRHNSFQNGPVPVLVRRLAFQEMPQSRCSCRDPFYRRHEWNLRRELFRSRFGDDYVFEPWITGRAVHVLPEGGPWGVEVPHHRHEDGTGSYTWDPPIQTEEDVQKLKAPPHGIDEAGTARRRDRLQEAVGDALPVVVDRSPACGRINVHLARLRGLGRMMLDMVERPEWLHGLLGFLRDGILRAHHQAERAGDWKALNHHNQSMPYAAELSDPSPADVPVRRAELWRFFHAQELTCVSPRMFDEFMVQYQLPIMREFALVAYGCCEDLTDKMDVLRRIPNLRRIAVTPAADVAACAEQIGTDYVISYRPNPADMVAYGWDPDRVRRILRDDLEACRGLQVDICLKDVETVQGDPERVGEWVKVAREVASAVES